MFKFIYRLTAWCATHYQDMPNDFKAVFPFEDIRDLSIFVSNIVEGSKNFNKYNTYE